MPSDPIRGWAPVLRTEYASLEFARLLKQIRKNAGLRSWNHDVGGEYAVYMMAWARKTPAEPAFPGPYGVQNLDAPPRCPYTSAVPKMDVILTPRGTKSPGLAEDFVRCRGAAN